MGLNWSKTRRRETARSAARSDIDSARYLEELDGYARPIVSKSELRAAAADAITRYTGPVHVLPTMIELKCYRCNHRGTVKVPPGERKRFKCSKCGAPSL